MNASPMRAALVCALLATSALATPVLAQSSTDQPAPPRGYNVDANGVDLVTGKFYLSSTEVTIGGEGGGLAYSRNRRELGYDDQYVTSLNQSGSVITVSIGALSDTFTAPGGNSTSGTGATLSLSGGNYRYTTASGVIYQFSTAAQSQRYRLAQQRVTSITYADGRVVSIEYDVFEEEFCKPNTGECFGSFYQVTRPSRVSSNDGYRLTLRYATNNPGNNNSVQVSKWMTLASATASNLTEEVCTSANCPPVGGTWRSAQYAWNAASSEETRTDAMGRVTRLIVSNGRITGIRPPGTSANYITIGYDGAGRVATYTIGNDIWTYAYADAGGIRTTTVSSPTGLVRTVKADLAKGKVIEDKTGTGGVTKYEYDSETRLTKVIRPELDFTTYGYDARDNVISAVATAKPGPAPTPAPLTTAASFPATCANVLTCNKPVTTTDMRGQVTDYAYDPVHGGVTSITRPAPAAGGVRPQTRYAYQQLYAWYKNASGVLSQASTPVWKLTEVSECATGAAPACVGTADETRTVIGYGAAGVANNLLPVSVTVRSGNTSGPGAVSSTSTMTYDRYGNLTAIDGPLAGAEDTTTMRYDAARAVVGTVGADPDGAGPLKRRAARVTYDGAGREYLREAGTVTGASDADWSAFVSLQQAASGYDAVTRRKVQETVTAGGVTFGLTQYSHDADGRPKCVVARIGLAASANVCQQLSNAQGYDAVGETLYGTDGRVWKQRDGGVDTVTYGYSANGQVASLTDAKGNLTAYSHDGHDRPLRTTYPGGLYEELGYNVVGDVTSVRKRDGAMLGYTYDALGRLTNLTTAHLTTDDQDIAFTYDNLGRLTRAAKNTLNQTVFAYDALGRKTAESNYYYSLASQYDAAGRRTRLTWGDGFYVTHDHLVTGEVSAIRENGAGVLASFSYDDMGRRTSLTRGNGTVTSYAYDPASRLTGLSDDMAGSAHDQNVTLAYDGLSRIRTRTGSNDLYAWTGHGNVTRGYTVNARNELTQAGGASLGYDANGNTTAIGGQAYGYSSLDRLAIVPGVTELFSDSLERLDFIGVEQRLLADDGASTIAEYFYSGGVGPIAKRYVHGPGVDEPLVEYDGSGTGAKTWLHADERGSIIARSGASGAVTAINTYDDHGAPGAGNVGRFQYTGQKYIPSIGMYDYKARIYDPKLGRFVQADPIGYRAGMNRYVYTSGDPVNRTDPNGMMDVNVNRNFQPRGSGGLGFFNLAIQATAPDGTVAIGYDHIGPGSYYFYAAQSGSATYDPIKEESVVTAGKVQLNLGGVVNPVGSFAAQNGSDEESYIIVTARGIKWRHYSETYGRGPGLIMTAAQDRMLQFRLLEISIGHAKARERLTARDLGLPGRKNTFYNVYTMQDSFRIQDGFLGQARIAHIPGSLNFFYSPYHYKPGPGAPDIWIMLHYSAPQGD